MTKSDFCGFINLWIKICAQEDSLCNPLLLLYKIVVFDFFEAIKLGAVIPYIKDNYCHLRRGLVLLL